MADQLTLWVGCCVPGCVRRHRSRGYCDRHYRRWQAIGHIEYRACPTCGFPIERGPGNHAYCSDTCRPECCVDGCQRPTRGTTEFCEGHRRPRKYHWTSERICVTCGAEVPEGIGRRKHCSNACERAGHRLAYDRPRSYDCALCGLTVSLIDRSKTGRFKRSDSSLCLSCKTKPFWSPLSVRQIAKRDGTNCGICGDSVDLDAQRPDVMRPSIDHILPRAHGGSDDADNLQLAHLRCNISKGARITEMITNG